MNLRIPNLLKGIANKIFNKKTSDKKVSEELKAELAKTMRISHGGNATNPKMRNTRFYPKRKPLTPKAIMQRANFGTFSPVNPNRQY